MITLAMLVKEPPLDRLALLLAYMAPVVGQVVIVVDDRTQDPDPIADLVQTIFPNRSITQLFTWEDDFSAARNAALPFINGDWTLWLDPDELPMPAMLDFLQAVDASPWGDVDWHGSLHRSPRGYLFHRVDLPSGTEGEDHWHLRLFRTGHGRWYRPLHELVAIDNQPEPRNTAILPKAPFACGLWHSRPETAERSELYDRISKAHPEMQL
jgi:glycosyltransferase involved in cell wall biosynthesis